MKPKSLDSQSQFQPRQLVCLEHDRTFLYGEVIEVISNRQLCWVRPLMLAIMSENIEGLSSYWQLETQIDLRSGADLILPLNLFRLALDTEIIPLLVRLENLHNSSETELIARQHLHRFIEQICQSHREIFQNS
ncbi:hypothetical protein IQ238_04895 [Pleurocapsales cyanobacterium LEGE 06147]|nr:hypothetical protein [Pleurocapsales cyanobacterium LEGE 06147]